VRHHPPNCHSIPVSTPHTTRQAFWTASVYLRISTSQQRTSLQTCQEFHHPPSHHPNGEDYTTTASTQHPPMGLQMTWTSRISRSEGVAPPVGLGVAAQAHEQERMEPERTRGVATDRPRREPPTARRPDPDRDPALDADHGPEAALTHALDRARLAPVAHVPTLALVPLPPQEAALIPTHTPDPDLRHDTADLITNLNRRRSQPRVSLSSHNTDCA
jgi:hypothetical protein